MKLYTEKEQIAVGRSSILKLRDLYVQNRHIFNQMEDFFPFPVYIKSEKTHGYHYANANWYKVGPELESLFLEGKKRLIELSDTRLLNLNFERTDSFLKVGDQRAVLSCPQKIILYGDMTPYLGNKALIDNEFSINIGVTKHEFHGLGEFFLQLSSEPEKELLLFDKYQTLTKREKEIFKYILEGYTNNQISDLHFISVNTVRTHRNRIWKKLDIKHLKDCFAYSCFYNDMV